MHGKDQLPLCTTHAYNGTTPFGRYGDIVGSCNGTLCLFDYEENHMNLWNPSTRHKLSLPDCSRILGVRYRWFGFGYDPINDDYKIIWDHWQKMLECSFVYSVKTRTWCEIASPIDLKTKLLVVSHFVNGVLHWVVHQHELRDTNLPYIMTFDLSTYVFGMIPLPDPNLQWETRLTTIQGSLALIYFGMDLDNSWIRVWRDASWSMIFKLGTNQPTNNGDLLPHTWCWGEGNQVCNPKTGARSSLVDFNATSHVISIIEYNESLHLLDIGIAYEVDIWTGYEENRQSISRKKKTSIIRSMKDLFHYFQVIFKPLCNTRR
ncbi:hypothetical protein LXL04_018476 [Taraxacum kok-saghyz]